MDTNNFNYEKLHKSEIQPLINEIKKICAKNKVPFFACVAVSNSEKGTEYEYDGVLPGFLNLKLGDDQFAKHLCVANGFEVRPAGIVNDFSDVSDFIANIPDGMFESYIEEIPEE